jgi:hypothetical protein
MPERVKQYRLNADRCFELAKRLTDPESKHSLLVIANAWLRLAAQRAKNTELENVENVHSRRRRA